MITTELNIEEHITMSDNILELSSEAASLALFGGKAYSLSKAAAAGHRVPPGFVVTTAASEQAVESLQGALATHVDKVGGERFAVRSSAIAEDSASRSFAGQLESILNVERSELLASIARCQSSAEALRVLRYGGGAGQVAVLVQRMVPADMAGVAFSADPRTGERGVVVIEAVKGLGDRLVSGEANPESWHIAQGVLKRTRSENVEVLTEEQAKEIATLASQMESLFASPQDIEWAFAGGELYLLQSRPITALPAAPVPIVEAVPEGDWQRDDHHAVLSPLGWAWFQAYPKAMAANMRKIGVPVREMRLITIRGNLYARMMMEGGGGDKMPPRWVLWLASRLLPSMRKAARTCEDLLENESYAKDIEQWENQIRPEMRSSIDALFVEDPAKLSDQALLARIQGALHLAHKGLTHHSQLGAPPLFSLGKLALFLLDELQWPMERAFELTVGASDKTTELHRSLEKIIVEHHEAELAGKDLPHTWAALFTDAPRLGAAMHAWMKENRLRITHYEPKNPTIGEQPELVLSIAESILWGLRNPSPAMPPSPLIEEARGKLSAERFKELLRLIVKAKRGYALRDENGIETVSRPSGLLRWFVLELGRRITREIGQAEYAVYLYPEEHEAALYGRVPNIAAMIEKRRGEESWALRNRGPYRFGKEPPSMPTDAFPRPLARVFRIFDWMMRMETPREEAPKGSPLVGVGLGSRVVTAKARVIVRLSELSSLRHGEVLVCRITSPEWAVALGRVGAIVTEEGGMLSHPAIIAREYGITAVLGAAGATQRIKTGDLVRVDPAGAVSLLS